MICVKMIEGHDKFSFETNYQVKVQTWLSRNSDLGWVGGPKSLHLDTIYEWSLTQNSENTFYQTLQLLKLK